MRRWGKDTHPATCIRPNRKILRLKRKDQQKYAAKSKPKQRWFSDHPNTAKWECPATAPSSFATKTTVENRQVLYDDNTSGYDSERYSA